MTDWREIAAARAAAEATSQPDRLELIDHCIAKIEERLDNIEGHIARIETMLVLMAKSMDLVESDHDTDFEEIPF